MNASSRYANQVVMLLSPCCMMLRRIELCQLRVRQLDGPLALTTVHWLRLLKYRPYI